MQNSFYVIQWFKTVMKEMFLNEEKDMEQNEPIGKCYFTKLKAINV